MKTMAHQEEPAAKEGAAEKSFYDAVSGQKEGEIDQEDAARDAENKGVGLQAAGLEKSENFAKADADIGNAANDQAIQHPTIDPVEHVRRHLLSSNQVSLVELIDIEFPGEELDVKRITCPAPYKGK